MTNEQVEAAGLVSLLGEMLSADENRLDIHRALTGVVSRRQALMTAFGTLNGDSECLVKIRSWINEEGGLFVLSGPPGCGKSISACAWLARRKGVRKYLSVRDVATASFELWASIYQDSVSVDSLVIDDVGSSDSITAITLGRVEALVMERFDHLNKPTLVTTNLDAETFWGIFDQNAGGSGRIADRILEDGEFAVVTCGSFREDACAAAAKKRMEYAKRMGKLHCLLRDVRNHGEVTHGSMALFREDVPPVEEVLSEARSMTSESGERIRDFGLAYFESKRKEEEEEQRGLDYHARMIRDLVRGTVLDKKRQRR